VLSIHPVPLSARLARWNPWRGLDALPRDVWTLAITTLVNRMGTMVIPFLALYVTRELGYTAGRAGIILGLYGLGAIVAAPLAGRLCDRLGARRVMRGALILSGCVMLLFPLCRSWPMLLAATLLLATTSEGYRPASFAALAEAAPESQRKAAFSLLRLAVNLGMSIGPAVGGFLAAVSYPAIFWVDGGTSILAGIVITIWPVGGSATAPRTEPGSGEPAPARSQPARRDGRFLYFLLACVPVIMVFFQHVGAMPLHLVGGLGFPSQFLGLLFTFNTILIVLLEVRLNMATARWPHGRSLALGALLVGVGFGGLAWSRSAWQVVATVVVWTFGEMILLPSMAAQVTDAAPPDRRGEYMGFYSMSFGVAFSAGPWLGTTILGTFGSEVLWPSCLVVAAASAILLWRVSPASHPARHPPR
jgi:MFS family permease